MSQARFPMPLIDRFFPSHWGVDNSVDRSIDLKTYLELLARDIEALCNTRASIPFDPVNATPPSPGTTEYSAGQPLTIMEWGLPDWTGFSPHSAETARLLTKAVQNALEAFEPRLHAVSVRQAEEIDVAELGVHTPSLSQPALLPMLDDGLRLRVDGRLTAQPSVRISFLLHINEHETRASELSYGF